jgi:hypothetical protein
MQSGEDTAGFFCRDTRGVTEFSIHTARSRSRPGCRHRWNYAEIGTITFPKAGPQLLTFHYNAGNNFAFFEFERIETKEQKGQ